MATCIVDGVEYVKVASNTVKKYYPEHVYGKAFELCHTCAGFNPLAVSGRDLQSVVCSMLVRMTPAGFPLRVRILISWRYRENYNC